MSIFKKNEKKNDNRLPMPDKVKRGYRWYCSLVATVALMGCCTMTAFAAPAGRLWTMGAADPESGVGLFEDAWLTGNVRPETQRSMYFRLHPWLPALALAMLLLVSFSARVKRP